jgi:hypothetical protein
LAIISYVQRYGFRISFFGILHALDPYT